LIVDDADLGRFMQQHDQQRKVRDGGDYFTYGRAFREVTSALHRLTDQKFDEMELNWVHLAGSASQQALQRAQFERVARRWADWWEANWQSMVDDPAFAKVDLPAAAPVPPASAGRLRPLVGAGLKLTDARAGWIVEAAGESKKRCFVDLDTMREAGWPDSLPPVEEIGVDSPELLAWARQEGFDMVGVKLTPPGETAPLYCLKPLETTVWKLTADEHRLLPEAIAGRSEYPLSRPVELMVPQRTVDPPYDYKYGGDSFLFVTREGTAGVIRMTAQVTDPSGGTGYAYSQDDQFRPKGFYRGAKVSFSVIDESGATQKASSREADKPAPEELQGLKRAAVIASGVNPGALTVANRKPQRGGSAGGHRTAAPLGLRIHSPRDDQGLAPLAIDRRPLGAASKCKLLIISGQPSRVI
jgi:hypothetical protein